jgi:hypothetical protein
VPICSVGRDLTDNSLASPDWVACWKMAYWLVGFQMIRQ